MTDRITAADVEQAIRASVVASGCTCAEVGISWDATTERVGIHHDVVCPSIGTGPRVAPPPRTRTCTRPTDRRGPHAAA